MGEDEEEEGGNAEQVNPTHYSELDPKNMKVADLRRELECRQLSSKGLKSQLIARLTKAIKSEQEKEEQEAAEHVEEEEEKPEENQDKEEVDSREEEKKKKEEEERKKKEEREKVARERRYTLPDNPTVLVHPNPTAKGGKFDCTVMSLSVLLDYRPEDNKEHSFEVSLFAELINEMLMRDFGFRIYKSLITAPDKKEEEKEKKDKEKEKEKEKDKDKDKEKEKEKDHHKDGKDKEKENKDEKDKKDDKEKSKEDKVKKEESEE